MATQQLLQTRPKKTSAKVKPWELQCRQPRLSGLCLAGWEHLLVLLVCLVLSWIISDSARPEDAAQSFD